MNLGDLHQREYGRILASLIRVVQDITLAEDALQEAFVAAHVQWPDQGEPANPVAWLMATARHKAIDQVRRQAWAEKKRDEIAAHIALEENMPEPLDTLRLMFTCCHPALATEARVALTLRTICGLNTEEIARAFLVPVATLAQRLVRAKTKIKLAGIPYEIPRGEALAERLDSVLAVIYLVFTEGYAASTGHDLVRTDLCTEAIRLARNLVGLLPNEREPRGLLALLLLNDARRATRVDESGDLVLLEDQDRSRWNHLQIAEGASLVEASLRGGTPGFYAVQAAIAALHAQAPTAAETDWPQIVALYRLLTRIHPSPIVDLNHAVAIAMTGELEKALALLEKITLPNYHRLPSARADLLRRLARYSEAATAYREALDLVNNDVERRFLAQRLADVLKRDTRPDMAQ